MKKWLVIIAVFISSLAVMTATGWFLFLLLLGPHSSLLPAQLQMPVGWLIQAAILGIPIWLAYKTFAAYANKANNR